MKGLHYFWWDGENSVQGYNVLLIYNKEKDKILMCKRRKAPFKGLYNLNGGKIELGENGLQAAYREMYEETGITSADITLTHLMDFTYYCSNCYVEVYAGRLKHDVAVSGDENELIWMASDHDFFDVKLFAGDGNVGHIVLEAAHHIEKLFL